MDILRGTQRSRSTRRVDRGYGGRPGQGGSDHRKTAFESEHSGGVPEPHLGPPEQAQKPVWYPVPGRRTSPAPLSSCLHCLLAPRLVILHPSSLLFQSPFPFGVLAPPARHPSSLLFQSPLPFGVLAPWLSSEGRPRASHPRATKNRAPCPVKQDRGARQPRLNHTQPETVNRYFQSVSICEIRV